MRKRIKFVGGNMREAVPSIAEETALLTGLTHSELVVQLDPQKGSRHSQPQVRIYSHITAEGIKVA